MTGVGALAALLGASCLLFASRLARASPPQADPLLAASAPLQECGGELTDSFGTISSPGFPDSYPPGSNCHWEIQAPRTRSIHLIFDEFLLEETPGCVQGDYLSITDPEGESYIFCGQEHPWIIESVGDILQITFVSDNDDEEGFRFSLTYVTVSKCEEGWVEFGEHCYFFSEEEMTYVGAEADCVDRNATLASIHSRGEQLFVQEHARRGTLRIGATTTGGLGEDPFSFEFTDGSANDFHNMWESGGEQDSPLECTLDYCGIHMIPDRWVSRSCSENKPVVCESTESHSGTWTCWPGPVCFHVSPRPVSFDEARTYCQDFPGADILVIADEEKLLWTAMTFYLSVPQSNEVWIGLRLRGSGDWEWLDGTPLTLDRWEQGHPTVGTECAAAATSSWYTDNPTSFRSSYVCKKSP